jgi:ribonuclease HI
MIKIYTDGAAVPNPGVGSYAFVATFNNIIIHEHVGFSDHATNNEMEYMGVIAALEWSQSYGDKKTIIHSDSQYVVNSMNDWCYKWKLNGWNRNKSGSKKVHNSELVIRCHGLMLQNPNVSLVWVRGHSGDVFNEYADKLCSNKIYSLTLSGAYGV